MLEILINMSNVLFPIFYKVLYMSLIGSILGILILVITKLFDNKLSAKWNFSKMEMRHVDNSSNIFYDTN